MAKRMTDAEKALARFKRQFVRPFKLDDNNDIRDAGGRFVVACSCNWNTYRQTNADIAAITGLCEILNTHPDIEKVNDLDAAKLRCERRAKEVKGHRIDSWRVEKRNGTETHIATCGKCGKDVAAFGKCGKDVITVGETYPSGHLSVEGCKYCTG